MTDFPSKDEFRAWLESLPPDQVVAEGWGCHDCPMARWLRATTKFPAPYIRPDETPDKSAWRPDRMMGANLQPLPAWANTFGNIVDGYRLLAVTAADCLIVLDHGGEK